MSVEYPTCVCCGKAKKTCSLEPSRSQLIFGGFNVKMEYRCQACETKFAKQIDRLLESK